MARRVQVDLDSAGMAELLNSAGVRAHLADLADVALASAVGLAPVETGAYRDGLGRESATTDRAVERVVASAGHSLVVEARTGTLARALAATGLPVEGLT